MSRSTHFSLGLLILVAFAVPVRADQDEAKKHYQRGVELFKSGDHEGAIAAYKKAYALVPTPAFVFNIGLAYRANGDRAKAVAYFEQYLTAEPTGPGADEAREYIHELEAAMAAERARQEAEAKRASRPPPPTVVEAPPPAAPMPAVDSSAGRGLRITGLSIAGAGALLVGTGVFFGVHASNISEEVSDYSNFASQSEYNARIEDGENAERNMFIFAIAGGASIVAGGVVYYLGVRARAETKLTAVPVATGRSVGLAVGGRF